MAIYIKYKTKKRSWKQTQLDDWLPKIGPVFRKMRGWMIEWRWQVKKEWHAEQKRLGIKNLPPLRRGVKQRIGPTRKVYDMSNPAHVAEVKTYKWFTRLWTRKRGKKTCSHPKEQASLDQWLPEADEKSSIPPKPVIPKFRKPRVVAREEYCSDITNLAWAALHWRRGSSAVLFYLFYMNDFSLLDDETLIKS